MIVSCGSCDKRYNFDESRLKGRTSGTLRCPNCKASIPIAIPERNEGPAVVNTPSSAAVVPGTPQAPGDMTTRLEADANLLPTSQKVPGGGLAMPAGLKISLAVLQGKDSGRIFPVEKLAVILGRGEADVLLDDAEVSRHHACIEVHGPRIVLKDLGSTNGTFVNDVKITQCEMENRGEFRVGGTRLMVILTDRDPESGETP
jgi:hypothetical protein